MNRRSFDSDRSRLTSDDGRAWLTIVGVDSSRDFGGGYVYQFELRDPRYAKSSLSCKIMISNIASSYATEYYEKKHPNFQDLALSEQSKYFRQYEIEFGATFKIQYIKDNNFKIDRISDAQYDEIGFLISQIYFRRYSRRSEIEHDPGGYYADRMVFAPYNPEIRFSRTYTSADVLVMADTRDYFNYLPDNMNK